MTPAEKTIQALIEALKVSPDNIPLKLHLAQTYNSIGRFESAEQELRDALSIVPHNEDVKLALAETYMQQHKMSHALVIVEAMTDRQDAPAQAHVLLAKLQFDEGKISDAVAQYKLALEKDPDSADEELGERLGVTGDESEYSDVVEGRVRERVDHFSEEFPAEIEMPKLKFSDVGGMEQVKEEISMKILYPLKHPEMYEAYGKEIGGGIMMYGPPGCGKTYLARATAGEMGAGFLSVGISDVLDMWTGQSERNLNSIFQQARDNQPCVLFFDEVDALGGKRSDMNSGSGRQLINQFLAEMDGVESNNKGVLILAATNAPWHVDPAFRRPGRFDRVLFVPPPDTAARAEILKLLLQDKPQDAVDFAQLAKKTEGFSGADLRAVVDQAVEAKLRDAFKTGRPEPVHNKDLIGSARRLKPTVREWFSTARNYALYSNQGGVYDDVLKYLKS